MFIKNDTSEKGKRYFNGKLGIIKSLEKDKIAVSSSNTSDDIEVQQETWENIRYTLNKQTRRIDEEVLGSFKQYPLRLAWAITIHKSQGLTFEKAIIDAGESFSPGQVYVALSRCTTLHGLVLQSRIRTSGLMNDKRIINFSKQFSSLQQLQHALQSGKGQYHLKLLLLLFDFSNSLEQAATLHSYLLALPSSFNETSVNASADIKNQLMNLQSIAIKFQLQLERLFTQGDTGMLSDRIGKAANHFNTAIKPLIDSIIHTPIITDSKLHAKEVNDIVKEIISQLSLKKFLWNDAEQLITTEAFLQRKNSFKTPSASVNVYAGIAQKVADSPHPVLHRQLRKVREEICSKNNLPVYIVAGSVTIDEMARYLPQTLEELEQINGFGEVKIGRYGNLFLEIILAYSKLHSLTSRIHEKSAKKERRKIDNGKPVKVNTKEESFRLFKEGKTVEDIAKERGFAIQTIQGHLAEFVQRGDINIEELVSHEKILFIEPAITSSDSISAVKEKLGNEISFGEIRIVMAWQSFKQKKN